MELKNSWKDEFIKRLNDIAGNNPAEFARKAGISDQLFRKYLKGSIPGCDKLLLISYVSGKSVDWLLTGKTADPGDTIFTPQTIDKYKIIEKIAPQINDMADKNIDESNLCKIAIKLLEARIIELESIKKTDIEKKNNSH